MKAPAALSSHIGSVAISRRHLLLGLVAGYAAVAIKPARAAAKGRVGIEIFAADGSSRGIQELDPVSFTAEQWRGRLTPLAYHVTREAGTERPFSGAYWNQHAAGLYRCICCDTALFHSNTKFESGTGWPSFWQPISQHNVAQSADDSFMMSRTAVECRRCASHLGHVFNDGPRPTGLRYCMNSVSLNFVAFAAGR